MTRQPVRVLWPLLGILILPACNGPSGPTPVFSQIIISGPESIAPGATGQFVATGIRAGRPAEDVTSQVTWTAFGQVPHGSGVVPTHVVRFNAGTGEATGLIPGEASIQAELTGVKSVVRTVFVLPPGTFRVIGTATDPPGTVASATVQVMSGAQTGMTAITNYWGEFAFYGLSGQATLQVSAAGYESASRTIDVHANRTETFQLRPLAPPADLTGTWDLSISLPTACRSLLPPPLHTRTQVATITTFGTFFDLVLPSPAPLRPPGSRGRILGTTFSLGLSYDDDYEHDYWEEQIGAGFLALVGDLTGTVETDTVRGTFNGHAFYRAHSNTPFESCSGPDGSFLMTRRVAGGS